MVVASLELDISLLESHSLKDKRRIVRSLKEKIRSRFNVSVAEVDDHDLWQRAKLGVAVVAADGGRATELLDKVGRFAEGDMRLVVLVAPVEFR
jgi:uncharacterized protein YlxP (DUF503 family)